MLRQPAGSHADGWLSESPFVGLSPRGAVPLWGYSFVRLLLRRALRLSLKRSGRTKEFLLSHKWVGREILLGFTFNPSYIRCPDSRFHPSQCEGRHRIRAVYVQQQTPVVPQPSIFLTPSLRLSGTVSIF